DAYALPCSPILSKVYQESNLRLAANRAALHPSAAGDCGVKDGCRAMIETRSGKLEVLVTLDAAVPKGVVQLAAAASTLELFASSARAKVVRI
ncbi:MAG: molybdopterin dinucleotide binding domain-containing protein, partial [Bryobacteraceae bacterium]